MDENVDGAGEGNHARESFHESKSESYSESWSESYSDAWSKRDVQVAILQSIFVAVVFHYGITKFLPYVMEVIRGYRITSVALSEVENQKSSRSISLTALENEAELLRAEVLRKSKTVHSKPSPQFSSTGERFRLKSVPDDSINQDLSIPKPHMSSTAVNENNSGSLIKGERMDTASRFRLGERINDSENGQIQPSRKDNDTGTSRVKKSSRQAMETISRSPTPQYTYISHSDTADGYADDRLNTISEQDLAYDIALRSDRTQMFIQEERVAEFNRISAEYTAMAGQSEPEIDDPESISITFKISDEVYGLSNLETSNAWVQPKHKKISRRFRLSDDVRNLFSFIFSYIYKFPGLEEKYLGQGIPPIFCPRLFPGETTLLKDSSDFVSFDLISSYPKVVLNSSDFFFCNEVDKLHPIQSVRDLGIKNNTLLSLRPMD
jgi:hypothetical protein